MIKRRVLVALGGERKLRRHYPHLFEALEGMDSTALLELDQALIDIKQEAENQGKRQQRKRFQQGRW